jgi:hypothetical protein
LISGSIIHRAIMANPVRHPLGWQINKERGRPDRSVGRPARHIRVPTVPRLGNFRVAL